MLGTTVEVGAPQLPSVYLGKKNKPTAYPSCANNSDHPSAVIVLVQPLTAHLPRPADFPLRTHFTRKKSHVIPLTVCFVAAQTVD